MENANPASPAKSLSVREDQRGVKALHSKIEKNRYKCVANFYFTIKAFVKFRKTHRKYNGYVLDVHRNDGVSM
jgi:ribosomal protein L35AE/L33A